jgi:hypothetical protein
LSSSSCNSMFFIAFILRLSRSNCKCWCSRLANYMVTQQPLPPDFEPEFR